MIKPAKYPCNGGEYTVAEIALALGVSSETVRIRLSKYGGNMQKVYDHYTKAQPRSNEDAVSEIMSALGLSETEAEATDRDKGTVPETQEPKQAQETAPAEQDAVRIDEEPVEPEETQELPMDAAPLAALHRLNRAIEALSGLYEGDVGGLSKDLTRIMGALRAIRAMRYEKYVDWDAVAYSGLRGVQKDEG